MNLLLARFLFKTHIFSNSNVKRLYESPGGNQVDGLPPAQHNVGQICVGRNRCWAKSSLGEADLGGCALTSRSSSGIHLALRGPNTMFPLNSVFKRQSCTSTATAEAEFVAACFGNRNELMPILDLADVILPTDYEGLFLEDNQAMIRITKTGRNPTMRHIGRTRRISLAWLAEHCGAFC